MYFLSVVECKSCHRTIWLPPPVQSELAPRQSPWRWGSNARNIACLACKFVFEYEAGDCRWEQLRLHQVEVAQELASHLLILPCGAEQCEGQIRIFVFAKRGLPAEEATEIAASLFARGIQCGRGHRSTGISAGVSSMTIEEF
jgi:hypothetical protein